MYRKMPDVVECAGCHRRLDPSVYRLPLNKEWPEEKVTRLTEPAYPHFSVLCTCGHYTVFSPNKQKSDV